MIVGSTVSNLARRPRTPRPSCAIRFHGYRKRVTSCNARDIIDRCVGSRTHDYLGWHGLIRGAGCAVAELTIGVESPGPDISRGVKSKEMIGSLADLDDARQS